MKKSAKITLGLAAVAVAGVTAFAVPAIAATSTPAAAPAASAPTHKPTPEAVAAVDAEPTAADECKSEAWIQIGSKTEGDYTVKMTGGSMVDRGAREFAQGEVQLDANGYPATYTVAPGDVPASIGDRFCIENGVQLPLLNGYKGGDALQPGDVITLNADLITDYVFPYAD
ncbi:hypothetical protein [Microbacterium sp. NPDC091662]|uniref:hypothetical protein n=1 Tax=Microbacterium sp. NPDC091662 TaxID=3364211 RepID=UPI00381EBD9F